MAEKAVTAGSTDGAGPSARPPPAQQRPAPARPARRIQVRRSGVHGKGVFALQDIAEGETIIEYVGEVITWKEAQRRHPHDPEGPQPYVLFPCRRRPGDRRQVRRQFLALDQPLVRPQLRGRRRGRPRLHQGPAQHPGRRRAQLRLRPDHRRALHAASSRPSTRAGAAPRTAAARCWLPNAGSASERKLSAASVRRSPASGAAPAGGRPQLALAGRSHPAGGGAAAAGLHGRGRCPRSTPPTANSCAAPAPGGLEPVLLVAEQQTAGRGRLGRGWAAAQAAIR